MNSKKSPKLRSKNNSKNQNANNINDKILEMSYEDSLKELDIILNHLQNEKIPIDKMHEYYIQANTYLEHCQKLLNLLEQEVEELNLENIT
ncbi:exodeoxyribonuclease VII small subunit [Prochlorococcus sp. MIT 1223]|uniref:exodeoxyribonuclease VII small subunit n=1 Tax=Prochlorococcus sp. MIT 1223 TaxID=3096217 RepID=UPI002A74C69D|nr:exodeoxyribonuclease VII small subunit [Prochlorococcus sp. MIT 1223]